MAKKQDFTNELNNILIEAKKLNLHSIEIISKSLHDRIKNKGENSMPNCCNAMIGLKPKNYDSYHIVNTTPSNQSTKFCIRYYL